MTENVAVSRVIAAPADQVWSLVSDLPRMGEWSNENVGGRWLDDAIGPVPGATFRGSNRNGFHRWSTKVTVVDAEVGDVFRFRVSYMGIAIAEWSYEFEDAPNGGCRVTESWKDLRPGWFRHVGRVATGVADRSEHTRAGMELTLDRLAATAEGAPESS